MKIFGLDIDTFWEHFQFDSVSDVGSGLFDLGGVSISMRLKSIDDFVKDSVFYKSQFGLTSGIIVRNGKPIKVAVIQDGITTTSDYNILFIQNDGYNNSVVFYGSLRSCVECKRLASGFDFAVFVAPVSLVGYSYGALTYSVKTNNTIKDVRERHGVQSCWFPVFGGS